MKKTMNVKLAVVAILLAIFMIPAAAQRGQGQRQGQGMGQGQGQAQRQRMQTTEADVEDRVDRLAESLQLNKDQKAKILAIEKEEFKKMQTMRASFDGQQPSQAQRDEMRAKMQATREAREVKYKEILTKEQYAKYIELRNQRNQNRQRPGDSQNQQSDRPARGRGR